jgi:hypothetical protein
MITHFITRKVMNGHKQAEKCISQFNEGNNKSEHETSTKLSNLTAKNIKATRLPLPQTITFQFCPITTRA